MLRRSCYDVAVHKSFLWFHSLSVNSDLISFICSSAPASIKEKAGFCVTPHCTVSAHMLPMRQGAHLEKKKKKKANEWDLC